MVTPPDGAPSVNKCLTGLVLADAALRQLQRDQADDVPENEAVPGVSPATCRSLAPTVQATLKSLAVVIVCLLCIELLIRSVEPKLSKDVASIREFPSIAAAIQLQKTAGSQTILFLGNSLTRHGINSDLIASELNRDITAGSQGQVDRSQRLARRFAVSRAVADGTGLPEWYYAFKHFFADAGQTPDTVVIGFEGRHGGHIGDDRMADVAQIGRFFCGVSDVPDVIHQETQSFDTACDVVLGKVLATYASRERIGRRLLDAVIPHYRDTSNRMNDAMHVPDEAQTSSTASSLSDADNYQRLQRFLSLARQHHVQVVLVAIPVPQEYSIEPQLLELAEQAHVPLIDARQVPGLKLSMFPDGLHMNEEAATLFSRYVATRLPDHGESIMH